MLAQRVAEWTQKGDHHGWIKGEAKGQVIGEKNEYIFLLAF